MWTNQSLLRRIQVIDDVLFTLAFSPDGQTLAAGGKSNLIWFYDVNSGERVGDLSGLPDWVFDVTYSPDGSQLLAASRDGAVMVWDVVGQRLVAGVLWRSRLPAGCWFCR